MKDNNNIQVLQNKLNRLLLNADYTTPTSELLDQTGSLSVHQMTAYHTALTTHKIIQSGKPSYIAEKFKVRNMNQNTRQGAGTLVPPSYSRNIPREGFIYRGAVLHNKLPVSLRTEIKLPIFKTGLKEWVKANIAMKPKSIFASISTGYRINQPPPAPPPPPQPPSGTSTRTITQYFLPIRPSRSTTPRHQDNLTTPTVTGTSRMMSLHHYFPPAQRVQQVGAAHDDNNG